ncbi:hypothetical protein D3C81_2307970 [compost metagenome]
MKREELQHGITYLVSGEGIKDAVVKMDNFGELWYGVPELMNPFECLTEEFQNKVLRNIK